MLSIRSLLFTPATKIAKLDRALASGADWVVLDLEDGVGPADKPAAREALGALSAASFGAAPDRIAVRINSLCGIDGIHDLAAMAGWPHWPAMIVVPKVESGREIEQVATIAQQSGAAPALLATVETARGVERAADILVEAPAVAAIGYGSADHCAETGGTMDWDALLWARGRIVNAAATAGIPAVDGARLDIRDADGLAAESAAAARLGFAGKVAIHPDQVGIVNDAFTPSPEESARARAVLAASARAGGGAFAVDGRMIDAPVLRRAQRIAAASRTRPGETE